MREVNIMKILKTNIRYFLIVSAISICSTISSSAQVEVINGIEYKQISNFETDYFITTMKISGDGTTIVFGTGGPAVKVFTIGANGTGLTQVYDFERTGTGPSVDISANGEKVIFTDGQGEIFIANFDGSLREELATLLPHPDPAFADMEPVIPLPPRITADGTQVLFIHMGQDPRGSGVWRINSDNTGLTQIFNYLDMSNDVFGGDGSEYNYNTAFADGFDISADGSRMILGTKIFKLADGDIDRGDAIAVDGTDFYHVGEYVSGTQPFSTYVDGDMFLMFRKEFNADLGYDEINVYFVPLGTGSPVKVISGLDIFGTSSFTQMSSSGTLGIVMGANGRLPITRVDENSGSRLDLVSIDGLSIAMGGYRFSESWLPSINWDGDVFCFLSTSIPPQIWVANINSDAINSAPSISQIKFEPDQVAIDGSTTSTISAHVSDLYDDIYAVSFDAYKDGVFQFRGLSSDYPYSGRLLDDGTFGDESVGDGFYTNNTVRADLPETPLGSYTVRIAAANATLGEVSLADAVPFSIVEPSTVSTNWLVSPGFELYQNFPNPFNQSSSIRYEIPFETLVEIKLLDVLGKVVRVMVNEEHGAGHYSVNLDGKVLPGGVYFYSMRAGDFYQLKKMQVLD